MKKQGKKYWEKRANERMAIYHKGSDKNLGIINKAYDKAIADIEVYIRKIFDKFVIDGDLSPREARQLLNSKISNNEMQDIKSKIDHIQDADLKKYLFSKTNAAAYKARITRLEALKESIYIECKKAYEIELQQSKSAYINTINEAYHRTMFDIQKGLGVGFDFAQIPSKVIETILNNPWSGKHFSKRIWGNTDVLAEKLNEIITSGFMSGKSIDKMVNELQDMSEYGKFAAERLIRTETTYMANMAEMGAYEEADIDRYIFLATLDLRTSKQCRRQDGKDYDVKEAVPGKNVPPLHAYCRSTTISYLGEDSLKGVERRARDPKTGKTYTIPADMKYKDWYKEYVVDKYGKDQADIMQKKITNKASDKKQYVKYKEVLGKEMPKTLEEFEELKYNDSEQWELLKEKYRDYKDKDLAIFSNDLPIPQDRKEHIWIGENKFKNPLKPEQGGGILKGGGHGQGAIDKLEEHYRLMESRRGHISDKKLQKRLSELGFEYREYENGVRIGNIFGSSDDEKKYNWGQTWFPKEWTENDIYEAGQYIAKLGDKNNFHIDLQYKNGHLACIYKYAKYKDISVGIIVNFDSNQKPYIGTIMPDKNLRYTPTIKQKSNSYYKKGV